MQAYTNTDDRYHVLIEKLVKIYKCHQNTFDQDTAHLERILATMDLAS